MHALTTGIAGYYLGKAKFSQKKAVFWFGLAAAILIHSAFNLFLFGGAVGVLLSIAFLVFIFVFLFRKMGSFEAQTIWKLIFLKDLK